MESSSFENLALQGAFKRIACMPTYSEATNWDDGGGGGYDDAYTDFSDAGD